MVEYQGYDKIIKKVLRPDMFEGFSQKTSDFLWELSFNNERPWFLAHKEEFEEVLNRPFKELAKETYELMCLRFPELDCRLHVARIYRDARRLFGRGPYKDHLWFSIKKTTALLEGPTFWFEIGAADYSYGMGFYSATAEQMERFRRLVDANPAAFERLAGEIAQHKEFRLFGEEYKRPKGHYEGIIGQWYNRKQLGLECCRDFGGDVLSPELPEILVDGFEKLMPMYEFFLKFYFAEEE